ncbi:MAG: DUF1844 domain-containing protein [Verrucomicrobiota bacterium]
MPEDQPPPLTESEQKFVQFVIMQAQQILYVLGTPAQEGEGAPNLEAAKMLIDQMEMLQDKTKGNLSEQEEHILKEALSRVQLAFVQSSGGTPASMMPERPAPEMPTDMGAPEPPAEAPEPKPAPAPEPPPAAPAPASESPKADPEPDEPEENKKRYVKKYG